MPRFINTLASLHQLNANIIGNDDSEFFPYKSTLGEKAAFLMDRYYKLNGKHTDLEGTIRNNALKPIRYEENDLFIATKRGLKNSNELYENIIFSFLRSLEEMMRGMPSPDKIEKEKYQLIPELLKIREEKTPYEKEIQSTYN